MTVRLQVTKAGPTCSYYTNPLSQPLTQSDSHHGIAAAANIDHVGLFGWTSPVLYINAAAFLL